jgi:hypothetical protein
VSAFEKDFFMQGKINFPLTGIALAIVALTPALGRAESLPTALLLYTFDSTSSVSGSTVVANSGSLGTAGSATLSGGATVISDATAPFLGKALSISSNSSGLLSTAANIIPTSDLNSLTISTWVKTSGIARAYLNLVGYFNTNASMYSNGWSIETAGTTGSAYFRAWQSGNSNSTVVSPASAAGAVSTSDWQQFTVTATGLTDTTASHSVTVNFYVNGSLLTTYSATTSTAMTTSNLQFLIGKLSWDPSLIAEYGYVALYDSALTASQVSTLYSVSRGAVPEPSTTVLTIIGVGGLLAYAWRKGKINRSAARWRSDF